MTPRSATHPPRSRFTRYQVPRASRPDADGHDRFYLFKKVSILRATYQIRLLLSKAEALGKRLELRVPPGCKLAPDLMALRREHPRTLCVERV